MKKNQNPVLSYVKSIPLFLFLGGTIFLISCGGIFIGIVTFSIGFLVTIPGAIWLISKILISFLGVEYAKKIALEMIAIFLITLLIFLILGSVVAPKIDNIYYKQDMYYSLILVFMLISSYRFHILYKESSDSHGKSKETHSL